MTDLKYSAELEIEDIKKNSPGELLTIYEWDISHKIVGL